MNRESKITDAQRQLLGAEAADELVRDELWLAQQLGPADAGDMPAGVGDRVMSAVRGELKAHQIACGTGGLSASVPLSPTLPPGGGRSADAAPARKFPRRRDDWRVAVAAILLFGVLVGLFVEFIMPRHSGRPDYATNDTGLHGTGSAQLAVNAYVGDVDRGEKAVGSVDSYLNPSERDNAQVAAQIACMKSEIKRLDTELANPDGTDNPWTAVASVIESEKR